MLSKEEKKTPKGAPFRRGREERETRKIEATLGNGRSSMDLQGKRGQ